MIGQPAPPPEQQSHQKKKKSKQFFPPPGLDPRPFRGIDSQRCLAEAGVGEIPGDPEGQRVTRAGGHGGRDLGFHGDQGAPGRDGGDMPFL